MDCNAWIAENEQSLMGLLGMVLVLHLMAWGMGRMVGANLVGRLIHAETRALRAIWRWLWNTVGDILRGIARWIGGLFGGGGGRGAHRGRP
ncbi:MAG: hypothetical protein AAB579_01230 [Patescibacteria group bacterium]